MNINLVMLMAGAGSRFSKAGFREPKPLITASKKPFFYWSTESALSLAQAENLIFVVLKSHVDDWSIDSEIKRYYPSAKVIALDEMTNGAVETALAVSESVKDDLPVIFNDCDHMFEASDLKRYLRVTFCKDIKSGLVTFKSSSPKYSYVKYDKKGTVIKTVEKEVVSEDAICGAYLFKNIKVFKRAAHDYINNCPYSEFFMSGVYNHLIKMGYGVLSFRSDYHFSFGTPEEMRECLEKNRFK